MTSQTLIAYHEAKALLWDNLIFKKTHFRSVDMKMELTYYKRRQQIKVQFSYLHFKHHNILGTLDELLLSIFFLESITPKTSEMKKLK